VASAAEVAANMRTALGGITSISATWISSSAEVTGPSAGEWKQGWTDADWYARAQVGGLHAASSTDLLTTAAGRRRAAFGGIGRPQGAPPITVATYDATAGIWSVYMPSQADQADDAHQTAEVYRDVPLGPPDRDEVNLLPFERNVVWAALANGSVSATTYDGRPALIVSSAVTPGAIRKDVNDDRLSSDDPVDRLEVTVDRESWFPMRVRWLLHGDVVSDSRLTHVRLNVPVSDAQVAPSFPEGTKVRTSAMWPRFRRVSLAEAAHVFTTPPLAPRVLPAAFRPVAAAVATRSRWGLTDSFGKNRWWPWSRDITALGYRDGFLSLTVTTRTQARPTDTRLDDPFAKWPALVATANERETVTLQSGALRGVDAEVAMPVQGVPHLWAFHGGRMITVAGDLTRDELLAVANSLELME
jgi:hypothetical protein